MSPKEYAKLYKRLEKVGFMAGDRKTSVHKVDEYVVQLSFNAFMKPSAVEVTTTMKVNNRSRGMVDRAIKVLTFYADGSAWVVIPGKLDEALAAVSATIKHFKEKDKA